MFSKAWELTGAALIGIAIAYWFAWEAGLLFGGLFLLVTGGTLNDAALTARAQRGVAWIRYAWWRQMARENGVEVPALRLRRPKGWVACDCGGDEGCPVCGGTGSIPDPTLQINRNAPHPPSPTKDNVPGWAKNQARARGERAQVHDRTPALSRQPLNGSDDFERLA